MLFSTTVQHYIVSISGGSHSVKTIRLDKDTLNKLVAAIGDKPLKEITIYQLREWQATQNKRIQNKQMSVYSIERYINLTKRFFRWCVEEELLEKSPAERLVRPKMPKFKPPKAISDEDLAKMLDAAQKTSFRNYALVRFLADTACRRGGISNLRFKDLDLANGKATVYEKGMASRTVYFGTITTNILRAYIIAERGEYNDDDFVFVNRFGDQLTGNAVCLILFRLGKLAGVTGPHNAHAFRHAWARRALQKGMDLTRASRILGHSTIRVTAQFYTCWTGKELKQAHRQYDTMQFIGVKK